MTVTDPGWVDTGSFNANPGQFPIRVERHLNGFVGDHLPGVTTVTTAARYYALHGLVARMVRDDNLDELATLDLLRRSEALLSYVTRVHSTSPQHDKWTPAPHGIDAIMRTAKIANGIDLPRAARTYSDAKWAFSNPYRGSELTLKILKPGAFHPGEWYDDAAARSSLGSLVEIARRATEVTEADAAELAPACLCTTASSADGAWLAGLLAGDPNQPPDAPTVGGLLWQFGQMVSAATDVGEVRNSDTLTDLVMFNTALREHRDLVGMVAPQRWRGAMLRKESVYTLRLIWRDINRLVGGARPVAELVTAFADRLPATPVFEFRAQLPPSVDPSGRPRAAERELDQLPDLERWIAVLMVGAGRLSQLEGQELNGFRSPQEHSRGIWEELSPGWTEELLASHSGRSMRDLGRSLAETLIRRSQRVALRKSRYDPRKRALSFPARLHVKDGVAVRIFEETAPAPATRIPQYLSIARQVGLFATDPNGNLVVGPNGGRLG